MTRNQKRPWLLFLVTVRAPTGCELHEIRAGRHSADVVLQQMRRWPPDWSIRVRCLRHAAGVTQAAGAATREGQA